MPALDIRLPVSLLLPGKCRSISQSYTTCVYTLNGSPVKKKNLCIYYLIFVKAIVFILKALTFYCIC